MGVIEFRSFDLGSIFYILERRCMYFMSKLVITLGNEDIVNLLNGRAVEFGIKDINLIRQGLKDVEIHVGMDIPMKYRNIAKPPLGVSPKDMWDRKRREDLSAAMDRYLEAGKKIPKEWLEEI